MKYYCFISRLRKKNWASKIEIVYSQHVHNFLRSRAGHAPQCHGTVWEEESCWSGFWVILPSTSRMAHRHILFWVHFPCFFKRHWENQGHLIQKALTGESLPPLHNVKRRAVGQPSVWQSQSKEIRSPQESSCHSLMTVGTSRWACWKALVRKMKDESGRNSKIAGHIRHAF